jgi:hypothetical protein
MPVREVAVDPGLARFLPGSNFADAYSNEFDGEGSAMENARRVLERRAVWLDGLMAIRNVLVRPFGLAGSRSDVPQHRRFVGFFPVLSESPDRVLLGLNDKHLDFRLIIDLRRDGPEPRLVATTLVKTHNVWGRCYLAVVKPFHRLILRALMRRV